MTPFTSGAQPASATDRDMPPATAFAQINDAPTATIARVNPDHRGPLQTASGFGVFAALRGEAVNATAPDRLVNGPSGRLFEESAGLGWRRENVSAMVGYMRPSDPRPAYQDESIAYHHARGRFGIGLSLHY